MILSNISKHKNISKLFKFIKYLNNQQIFKKSFKKSLVLLNKRVNASINYTRIRQNTVQNQNVIRYVINIIFSPSNTTVNLADIKGNTLISISEKSINLSRDSKKFQPAAAIKIFRVLLKKANIIQNKAVAINFKNTKRYQKSFCIKMLRAKVYIKSIQSYNFIPHNGCRPKKLKRIKLRTKRLVLK